MNIFKRQSPREAELKAREAVLSMFPKNGSLIRWLHLEEKARKRGMSLRTLRKHLEALEAQGRVKRIVKQDEKPPGVYYQLQDPAVFNVSFPHMPEIMEDMGLQMLYIEKLRGKPEVKTYFETVLRWQLWSLKDKIIRICSHAITLPNDQAAVDFVRTMVEDYVHPIINNLALLLRVHQDLFQMIQPKLIDESIKELEQIRSLLEKFMELKKGNSHEGVKK